MKKFKVPLRLLHPRESLGRKRATPPQAQARRKKSSLAGHLQKVMQLPAVLCLTGWSLLQLKRAPQPAASMPGGTIPPHREVEQVLHLILPRMCPMKQKWPGGQQLAYPEVYQSRLQPDPRRLRQEGRSPAQVQEDRGPVHAGSGTAYHNHLWLLRKKAAIVADPSAAWVLLVCGAVRHLRRRVSTMPRQRRAAGGQLGASAHLRFTFHPGDVGSVPRKMRLSLCKNLPIMGSYPLRRLLLSLLLQPWLPHWPRSPPLATKGARGVAGIRIPSSPIARPAVVASHHEYR